jgi:hypothetical protein
VAVGAVAFCDVTIRNSGACELLVFDVGFSEDTPFPSVFSPASQIALPFVVPAASATSLRFTAHPIDPTASTGTLILTVRGGSPIEIPLSVQGVVPTTCAIRISSLNGTAVAGDVVVAPFDLVGLTVEGQTSADRTIVAARWTLLELGPDTSITLSAPNAATTDVIGFGVGGFAVEATVTDDLGIQGSCTFAIEANAAQGLAVQLIRNTASDLDLHLVRNGTGWCGVDDCYDDQPTRDWGGGQLDPVHHGDAFVENIIVEVLADGDYTVGVGGIGGGVTTTATVRVFFDGRLEYEGQHGISDGDTWQPARVEVRDGVGTLVPLEDTSDQPGACWGR